MSDEFDLSEFFKNEINPLLTELFEKMTEKNMAFVFGTILSKEKDGRLSMSASCHNNSPMHCKRIQEAYAVLRPEFFDEMKKEPEFSIEQASFDQLPREVQLFVAATMAKRIKEDMEDEDCGETKH